MGQSPPSPALGSVLICRSLCSPPSPLQRWPRKAGYLLATHCPPVPLPRTPTSSPQLAESHPFAPILTPSLPHHMSDSSEPSMHTLSPWCYEGSLSSLILLAVPPSWSLCCLRSIDSGHLLPNTSAPALPENLLVCDSLGPDPDLQNHKLMGVGVGGVGGAGRDPAIYVPMSLPGILTHREV